MDIGRIYIALGNVASTIRAEAHYGVFRGIHLRARGASVFLVWVCLAQFAAGDETASIAEQAHGILAERCFKCHGPARSENGLRLDIREDALSGGDSQTPAIAAGDADNSLLIRKVSAADPAERMPKEGERLSPAEIAVLRAWIDAGAPWPLQKSSAESKTTHWSFVAPIRPWVPSVESGADVRNPIDAFILAELARANRTPTPEADRYTLIRRAHLELVGLPPSPEEVIDFVNDPDPDAFEGMIDRLLQSRHYGERQARRWLDAARYADTNGFEKDRPRSIWPYRDWVIGTFNENMPYDQFVVEQLAGDLLPDATEAQRVATGFHRNTMFNEEGGIDAAEDWFKRTIDRVNTTGTVLLGLTIGCAQCHAHKYDPISQKEFFSLFAFFNDAQETTLRLSDPEIDSRRAEIQDQLTKLDARILRAGRKDESVQADYRRWRTETTAKAVAWTVLRPVAMSSEKGAALKLLEDGSVLVGGDIPNDDVYVLEFDAAADSITALRLEALPHEDLPGGGPGRGTILAEGDFLLTGLELALVSSGGEDAEPISIAAASHDYAATGRGADQALDGKDDTGWSIKGATGRPHQAVYAFETPIQAGAKRIRVTLVQDYIHQHTLGHFRISVTSHAGDVVATGVPAEIEKALLGVSENRNRRVDDVERHYLLEVAPGLAEWHKQREELRASLPSFSTTLTMTKRAAPRTTYRYRRGNFNRPGRQVDFGVPAVLPPLPADAPRNRLTLARWIVDRNNPLTARVAMNRLWQHVFGRGLVNTPEDFGLRGDRPSHPALLDWLAVEFMERGWDMQAMHRLMVTSAAFRRSSRVTPVRLKDDPENVLLARGLRFRLDAEVIRDTALSASGLLNATVGGPSVYPPQPAGVSELAYGNSTWPESTGPDRYRRGLYTYLKRTAPYPSAATFDAASADETCVRRRRTNTPIQALTLLNDQVFVEASQALAQRVLRHEADLAGKIDYLFLLCVNRPADASESERIAAFFRETRDVLEQDIRRAWEIAGPIAWFEAKRVAEQAAWTAVCRVVLNLDETITQG